jgi:hypothetical protein
MKSINTTEPTINCQMSAVKMRQPQMSVHHSAIEVSCRKHTRTRIERSANCLNWWLKCNSLIAVRLTVKPSVVEWTTRRTTHLDMHKCQPTKAECEQRSNNSLKVEMSHGKDTNERHLSFPAREVSPHFGNFKGNHCGWTTHSDMASANIETQWMFQCPVNRPFSLNWNHV